MSSPVEDAVQVALRGRELGPVVVVVARRPLAVLHVDLVLVGAALRARASFLLTHDSTRRFFSYLIVRSTMSN